MSQKESGDLISLSNGWELFSLVKTPRGYVATIEKGVSVTFHPHFEVRYKVGEGPTQREAVRAALNMRGVAWSENVLGVRTA